MNKILSGLLALSTGLGLAARLTAAEAPPVPGASSQPAAVSAVPASASSAPAVAPAADRAAPDATQAPTPAAPAGATPAATQPAEQVQVLHFDTPDAAALALIEAAAATGPEALLAILGPDLTELVSGDPVADAADRRWFVENARLSAQIEDEHPDFALLVIGPDNWPFPIPLLKDEGGWYFDTAAGRDEVLNRRIGRNELFTLAAMRAFVQAQGEYAAADPQRLGRPVFADRILSNPGQKDGLYWPTAAGEPPSPLGPLVAEAVAMGYDASPPTQGPRPFHGYLYKILTAQGDQAPGGAMSYRQDGRLIQGFGLLAWPASYGYSGIMTFLVNQRGLVHEKDLGEDTATLAPGIEAYNPGEGWRVVAE